MARIKKEWIEDGAIDQNKITLTAKLSDNDTSAPSADIQLANKKYVDDQVATISIPSVFELQGNYNASTNTPALADTDTSVDNFLYYVNVAGSQDFGAGSKTFAVGDWVYNINGAWEKADNNDDVTSVNGEVGAVVLDTGDIAENGNLYYTEARFDTSLSGKSTTDVAEGANLYYTDVRAKTAVVVNSSAGSETDQAMSVAASKAYADSVAGGASRTFVQESINLSAGDITNGYVDLTQSPIFDSMHVSPKGGPVQELGIDYTVASNRLTFLGDLATYLVAGQRLMVSYAY